MIKSQTSFPLSSKTVALYLLIIRNDLTGEEKMISFLDFPNAKKSPGVR